PEPVDDPKADLQLDAGEQVLNGSQALGLARSRASTEHGSDLGRIENQQRMIGAILREVTEGDILTSPSTLLNFLDSVTDSMVTDEELTLEVMMDLAVAMREVDLERMNMVTVPVMDHPTDPNRVVLQEPAAQELLESVAAGEALPEEDGDGETGDGDAEVAPEEVSLTVLNNTGQDGLATEGETLLNAEGFTVVGTGNPETRAPDETTVYHAPEREEHAELVASALTSARTEEVPDLGEDVELVMGAADWGPVVGLDGQDDDGEDPLTGLDGTTAATDEVSCD